MAQEDKILDGNIQKLDAQLIQEKKLRLRHEVSARRSTVQENEEDAMEAAAAVMHRILHEFQIDPTAVVSGYWPTGSELDLRPTMTFLSKTHTCCLPIIEPETDKLVFSKWQSEACMVQGAFNIMEPEDVDPVTPDVCLIPLMAFDRQGNRLGYGGSYYDAYLSSHDVMKVGVAYSEQEVDAVPMEPHDHKMDWIVTPKEIICCDPNAERKNTA